MTLRFTMMESCNAGDIIELDTSTGMVKKWVPKPVKQSSEISAQSPLDWSPFGTHANHNDPDAPCSYGGPLEFSETAEDGLPNWERHKGCPASISKTSKPVSENDDQVLVDKNLLRLVQKYLGTVGPRAVLQERISEILRETDHAQD